MLNLHCFLVLKEMGKVSNLEKQPIERVNMLYVICKVPLRQRKLKALKCKALMYSQYLPGMTPWDFVLCGSFSNVFVDKN